MNTKKLLVYFFICDLVLLLTAVTLFFVSKSRTFQFFGKLTNRVETQEKVIALTFDDGPTEHTKEVLEMLEDAQVKATFFYIGTEIERFPQVAKLTVEKGHQIGNHSYTHPRFLLKSPSFVKNEVNKTNELIKAIGYQGEVLFRPPFGKKLFTLPWYLKQQNIHSITWDIEPETNPEIAKSEAKILEDVLKNTKPGSIILLHPNGSNEETRKVVPKVIKELKAQGYKFVTVSELLELKK